MHAVDCHSIRLAGFHQYRRRYQPIVEITIAVFCNHSFSVGECERFFCRRLAVVLYRPKRRLVGKVGNERHCLGYAYKTRLYGFRLCRSSTVAIFNDYVIFVETFGQAVALGVGKRAFRTSCGNGFHKGSITIDFG